VQPINGLNIAVFSCLLGMALPAWSQPLSASDVLEDAAEAMGGLDRILGIGSLVMTGFGQTQSVGQRSSAHPMSPAKWTVQSDVVRSFDLDALEAVRSGRQLPLFPFAASFAYDGNANRQVQVGIAALNHPLAALRAALDSDTEVGRLGIEDDSIVVELLLAGGETLWLGINQTSRLPAWVRWIEPSSALGEVTYTTWFTGYSPFDGVNLPSGLTTQIDWRDLVTETFHVDSYQLDADLPPVRTSDDSAAVGEAGAPRIAVTPVADGVWDLRIVLDVPTFETNGAGIVEFGDHLLMFEAYGSEAYTLALIDAANDLVPGKQVTDLVVSHHHFDHSGGLRAAVASGLTIISKRENEAIFREMVSRPAPNFPDLLARNPQPLKFVPVDEHLVLEDPTMRVDVYRVVGHLHMADAVFAYVPERRVLMQGDMFVIEWDMHWWGDSYLDSIAYFDLDPAIDIPVHGRVSSFEEVIENIERQVDAAAAFCAKSASSGIQIAGCPVKYSRD
jgi:glyoxylase-like metal-dependent hydrolase (beta-lactamase superfamily II)